MRMPALVAYATAVFFALAGCQAAGGDPSAPPAAAPPAAIAPAPDSTDTATDAVQGQPKRHHYRSPLSQRRIRNRHAVPR
jgi:hypothetical protein